MPPDVTERQDEMLLEDIMKHDREVAFRKWANRHGIAPDAEDESELQDDFAGAQDYRYLFGARKDD